MIKNYFKIAFRNLWKNRFFSGINILGLCIGFACSMMIVLYILDEIRFDKYHPHATKIFRVADNFTNDNGEKSELAYGMAPLAAELQKNFASIKSTLRIYKTDGQLETPAKEKVFVEDKILFADSMFFDFFKYAFMEGNAAAALQNPFSLVLTKKLALKYFGPQPALGKTLRYKDDEGVYLFTVTGVVDETKVKSHLDFDVLGSMASLRTIMPWFENWDYPPVYTYIMTNEAADYTALAPAIKTINKKILRKDLIANHEFQLQPLGSIHLQSHREGELKPNNDSTYLYVFGAIALLVLLIASVNFMNMSIAGAIVRKKEIGVRKSFGAQRGKLITQFLSESLVLTAIAFVLGLVLVKLALPVFNQFLGRNISFVHFLNWPVILSLAAIIMLVTLVSGGYPAFLLSSFKPSAVLKDAQPTIFSRTSLQKGLVVFQFVISSLLITSAIVVYYQLNFMKNKKLGFQKEHVVVVALRDMQNQVNYEPLKQRWLQNPAIKSITGSSGVPTKEGLHDFKVKPKQAAVDSFEILTLTVDHDFVKTYGMEIVAGRDFSKNFTSDTSSAFLINESAAKLFGWQDPVNREINLEYYFNRRINKTGTVVGVVKDFHYHSLRKKIDPLVLHIVPASYYYDYLSVKVSSDDIPSVIAFLKKEWTAYNSSRAFEYSFLDDYFTQLYRSENRFGDILLFFSLLAISIACVGLFALVAFVCRQRTKEVGIRKVLGASVGNITALLSKDFLKLVLLAVVIATPVSWFAISKWLQDFAYRINISWWVFASAGLIALLIALLTVSSQAIKAAVSNPVKSLRTE